MENVWDRILKDQGLNYEDLTKAEQETYNKANFSSKTLSIGDIKNYISYMKNAVAMKLSDTLEGDLKNPVLKARLKNYILIEMFLTTPERTEEAFKEQIKKKGDKQTT